MMPLAEELFGSAV